MVTTKVRKLHSGETPAQRDRALAIETRVRAMRGRLARVALTGSVDQVRDLETSLRALEVLEALGIDVRDALPRGLDALPEILCGGRAGHGRSRR